MSLTGPALRWVLVVATVGLPVFAVWAWGRTRGPRWLRAGQRLGLVAAAQAVAVFLTFTLVNDSYDFYASWADLFGQPVAAPAIVEGTGASGPLLAADQGRLVQFTDYTGPRSGIRAPVLVHLPPQYDDPAYARTAFPVVEFLPGWRNSPRSWISQWQLFQTTARLSRAGRMVPFIAVMPTMNVALPRDTECTDVPGSTQSFSWLADDIPTLVHEHFRALMQAASWGAIGYSTGGYCAAKLAYLRPQQFHVAAVLSGYFNALKDDTTGDLWGGSADVRHHNDLLWLAKHGVHPGSYVLVYTSRQDPTSYVSSSAFLKAAKLPTRTYSLVTQKGGHNLKGVVASFPSILEWLTQHLAGHHQAIGA